MDQATWTKINWLDRAQIVALLEGVSIQCYDHETIEELKEALVANIEDGTIPLSALDTF